MYRLTDCCEYIERSGDVRSILKYGIDQFDIVVLFCEIDEVRIIFINRKFAAHIHLLQIHLAEVERDGYQLSEQYKRLLDASCDVHNLHILVFFTLGQYKYIAAEYSLLSI